MAVFFRIFRSWVVHRCFLESYFWGFLGLLGVFGGFWGFIYTSLHKQNPQAPLPLLLDKPLNPPQTPPPKPPPPQTPPPPLSRLPVRHIQLHRYLRGDRSDLRGWIFVGVGVFGATNDQTQKGGETPQGDGGQGGGVLLRGDCDEFWGKW